MTNQNVGDMDSGVVAKDSVLARIRTPQPHGKKPLNLGKAKPSVSSSSVPASANRLKSPGSTDPVRSPSVPPANSGPLTILSRLREVEGASEQLNGELNSCVGRLWNRNSDRRPPTRLLAAGMEHAKGEASSVVNRAPGSIGPEMKETDEKELISYRTGLKPLVQFSSFRLNRGSPAAELQETYIDRSLSRGKSTRSRAFKFITRKQPGESLGNVAEIAKKFRNSGRKFEFEKPKTSLAELAGDRTTSVKAALQSYCSMDSSAAFSDTKTWWWNEVFATKFNKLGDRYISLLEHPVPCKFIHEEQPTSAFLTKSEQSKLTRKQRQERQQAKRDQVLLGVADPEPAKVKLRNVLRVANSNFSANPTKEERKILEAIEQRRKNHDQRNTEAKLSEEQKSAKKMAKWLQVDSRPECIIYRHPQITSAKTMFKLVMNAKQLHLVGGTHTVAEGTAASVDAFSVTITQGGPRAIRKFKQLMESRIDWNLANPDSEFPICTVIYKGTLESNEFSDWDVYVHDSIQTMHVTARKYYEVARSSKVLL